MKDAKAKTAAVEKIIAACKGQCDEASAVMMADEHSGVEILKALDILKYNDDEVDVGNLRKFLQGILAKQGAAGTGRGNAKLDYYTATDWERWQCLLTTINLRMAAVAGTGPVSPPKFDRLCAIASELGEGHDCEAARRALLQEAET